MKKIVLAALAAAAMVAASCNSKIESGSSSDPASGDFRLNITVAGLGSDDSATKSLIKTGWAAGDLISIWYDSMTPARPTLLLATTSLLLLR